MKNFIAIILGLVTVSILLLSVIFFSDSENITGFDVSTSGGIEQYSAHLGGVGSTVITLDEPKILEKIVGRTCYKHKKTGDYYRFKFTATGKGRGYVNGVFTEDADLPYFTKEFPQSPNWFGGKGGNCMDILILPPTKYMLLDRLVIEGVKVKGGPSFSADITLFVKPRPKTDMATSAPQNPSTQVSSVSQEQVPLPQISSVVIPVEQTFCCVSTSAVYQLNLVKNQSDCAKVLGGPKCLFPAVVKKDCTVSLIDECRKKSPSEQFIMSELTPTLKPVVKATVPIPQSAALTTTILPLPPETLRKAVSCTLPDKYGITFGADVLYNGKSCIQVVSCTEVSDGTVLVDLEGGMATKAPVRSMDTCVAFKLPTLKQIPKDSFCCTNTTAVTNVLVANEKECAVAMNSPVESVCLFPPGSCNLGLSQECYTKKFVKST